MKNHLVFSAERGKEVTPDSTFAKYYAHHLFTSIPANAFMQVKQRSHFVTEVKISSIVTKQRSLR